MKERVLPKRLRLCPRNSFVALRERNMILQNLGIGVFVLGVVGAIIGLIVGVDAIDCDENKVDYFVRIATASWNTLGLIVVSAAFEAVSRLIRTLVRARVFARMLASALHAAGVGVISFLVIFVLVVLLKPNPFQFVVNSISDKIQKRIQLTGFATYNSTFRYVSLEGDVKGGPLFTRVNSTEKGEWIFNDVVIAKDKGPGEPVTLTLALRSSKSATARRCRSVTLTTTLETTQPTERSSNP